MFELRYKRPVEKYFKKIRDKSLIAAYRDALTNISADPYNAGEAKTGDLAGIYCRDVYCDKVNYEIAYQIFEEDSQFIIVILAGTRCRTAHCMQGLKSE
jgi:hypothetical protein